MKTIASRISCPMCHGLPARMRRAARRLIGGLGGLVLLLGAPAAIAQTTTAEAATQTAAQAAAPAAPAAPPDNPVAVLYHNYCSVCHGDKGDGRSRASGSLSTRPRDFTSEASRRELSRERIVLAITHGRPGTAMVGWKTQLSPADIDALADHLLRRFVHGHPGAAAVPLGRQISGTRAHGGRQADGATPATTAAVDMAAAFPAGLQGQAGNGAAFYLANCATCHGARGDGAGPRAYFINPKPRNFLEAAARARFNRTALYTAVSDGRVGTEMPAWRQVIDAQQIADVSEYVFQTFIRPPAAGTPDSPDAAAPR